METIKNFFTGIFGAAAGVVMIGFFICYGVGTIYWIWMSIQIGSFWMFLLGVAGPTILFTGLVGGYSMIFGTPNWVLSTFG